MEFKVQYLKLAEMSALEIEKLLKENKIGLTVTEAKQVEKMIGREPTLTELIMFGIQGSEHCSYRSSREHLKKLPTKGSHVIVPVGEDSGIVELAKDKKGNKYGVIIAHESHNHPSQIVPYEGAATGVGGIIRDIVCMGGEAIATLDPLRFGNIRTSQAKWIYDNVISGIAGYGNPLGVCNLGGDVYFDESFQDNCLVNVVALGFIREDEIIHSRAPKNAAKDNYDIILVGKPTDNSGMGGASFASFELHEENEEANKSAVQEPNPFLEQHILTATYELFKILKEKKLIDKVGFKDLGAGGIMCATVELAESGGFGAEIDLNSVHVAMENLHPSVIACSETQERFAWVVPPSLTTLILTHYNEKWALPKVSFGAKASVIGKIKEHKKYIATYNGKIFCDVLASDLTSGLRYSRPFKKPESVFEKVEISEPSTVRLKEQILCVLGHEDVASRKSLYENYDKHVKGLTVIESGLADAGVMAPFWGRDDQEIQDIKNIGFAVSVDSNPRQSSISPYLGAFNAVAESVRNIACTGAYPLALTDCLNYGNPEKEGQMWEFTEGIRGLKESVEQITLIWKDAPIPYVSGNVSFYNQSKDRSVAPSAIVCCLGKIDDVKKSKTMEFKTTENPIYMLGKRKDELGGSVYYSLLGQKGLEEEVPIVNGSELKEQAKIVIEGIMNDFILAAHDISDGGLITTIAEMCIGGNGLGKKGALIKLDVLESELPLYKILFSETGGFVLEIDKNLEEKFIKKCLKANLDFFRIGTVETDLDLKIELGKTKINLKRSEMEENWLFGLQNKLN